MKESCKLKHVHFQITRNCNLRCSFCGQWGKKGFFSDAAGEEMTFDDWMRLIDELDDSKPKITVWGGEPLTSVHFDAIMKELKARGFETEIVTNGMLIDKHIDVIRSCCDKVYVSIDGIKEIHDYHRGNGVYERVTDNLKRLAHHNVTVMSVITPELIYTIDSFLEELEDIGIKELYLQDMIGLSEGEIMLYKLWMRMKFKKEAEYIDSWYNDELFKIGDVDFGERSYKIIHKKHAYDGACRSMYSHAHVSWNGDVMYCTDFYDFSAGNVKDMPLLEIFTNEISEKFRSEVESNSCMTCNHCSWRKHEYL